MIKPSSLCLFLRAASQDLHLTDFPFTETRRISQNTVKLKFQTNFTSNFILVLDQSCIWWDIRIVLSRRHFYIKAGLVGVTVLVSLCGIIWDSRVFSQHALIVVSIPFTHTAQMSKAKIFISYISNIPPSPHILYQSIQLSLCRLWSIGTIALAVTGLLSRSVQFPSFCGVLIMLTSWAAVRTRPEWAGDHAHIILLFAPQHFLGRQPAWGNSHFSTACSHGTSLTFKLTWKPFSEWTPLSHLLALVPLFGQVVHKNQCCFLLSMHGVK